MKLLDRYVITFSCPVENEKTILDNVVLIDSLEHGHYHGVYYRSAVGQDVYSLRKEAEPMKDVDENKQFFMDVVKIELSIKNDDELLDKIVSIILQNHPWKEPVLRVYSAKELRKTFVE